MANLKRLNVYCKEIRNFLFKRFIYFVLQCTWDTKGRGGMTILYAMGKPKAIAFRAHTDKGPKGPSSCQIAMLDVCSRDPSLPSIAMFYSFKMIQYERSHIWSSSNFQYCCSLLFNIVQNCLTLLNIVHHFSTLFNIVQYCSTLFKIVQYCSTFFNIVQYCSTLFNIVQYCSTLFNIVQYCSKLFNIAQHCSSFFNIVQYCSTLFNIVQHCSEFILVKYC